MNKTALVTGGASGLGYELALLLAKDTHNLVLVDIDAKKLQEAKQEIETKFSVQVQVLDKDLSKANISEEIMLDLNNTPIDVLVNNAGFGLFGSIEETSLPDARNQFEVNLFGPARIIQLVISYMRKQKFGKIINVGSVAGKIYTILGGWYHATNMLLKDGVIALESN